MQIKTIGSSLEEHETSLYERLENTLDYTL